MPVYVRATTTRKGYRRAHTRALPGGGKGTSILRELKNLRSRQTKAIDDSIRLKEAGRIKQLEKALHKKKDKARVFKLKASFKARGY